MKEIIDKISSYNLFNYLFPGIIFVILLNATTSYSLIQENIIEGAFLYYFIGLLINRVGSLFIEPILKRFKFVKFKPPEEYRRASQLYPKIEIFSETNNMFRGMCATFFVLVLIVISENIGIVVDFSNRIVGVVFLLLLLLLFLFSYRKQTKIIFDRIDSVLSNHKKE
jgi:hypothetical protein